MIEPNFRPNRRPELIAPIENQDSLGFYSSAFQVLQPRENKSPKGFRLTGFTVASGQSQTGKNPTEF